MTWDTDYLFLWIHLFRNLNGLPEVSHRDSHGAIFVNVPKEIPQAQLALIKVILRRRGGFMKYTQNQKQMISCYSSGPEVIFKTISKHTWITFIGSIRFGCFLAIKPPTPPYCTSRLGCSRHVTSSRCTKFSFTSTFCSNKIKWYRHCQKAYLLE